MKTVLIVCRDANRRPEFEHLASKCQLIFSDTPSGPLGRETPHAVVAFLDHKTLDGTAPDAFFAELEAVCDQRQLVAIIGAQCPERLRKTAEKRADTCLVAPFNSEKLSEVIFEHRDPVVDMAGLCSGLPHRVLHGRTRSLITFTPSLFDTLDEIKMAAAHDVTMLLVGETGTGKTFLARLIHELSPRCHEQSIVVACGALPPDLLESEMFGYVRGAFTGADRDKQGKFAAAGRGSLLLDEIDVLPLEQQAKLLRVIETGDYEPVGSNVTQSSQAGLIVASNYDLEQLVQAGSFRQDLYYRLNVLKFHLPPLRERPADIEYLARNFALLHSRKHQIQLREIDTTFIDVLQSYAWPGNIRELENVVRRAVLYCRRGVLTANELPSNIRSATACSQRSVALPQPATLEEKVGLVERRIIEDSLRRNGQHRQDTAKELGISRVTLYNKMKKFGMLTTESSV